jgi:His/Glu/Gln/Arg/opine family amino acid ABC transporter permease subunit
LAVTVTKQVRPPLWRNATFLKWAAQLSFLFGVIAIAAVVIPQVGDNLSGQNLTFGFNWLEERLGFLLGEGIDIDPSTGGRTILVGAVNTLRVTISGIIAATILGTLIGVARLSTNFIVNKVASLYIETLRNIPLLLWIFFFGAIFAVFSVIDPVIEGSIGPGKKIITFTRKGVGVSWIQPWGGFYQWLIWVAIGGVVAYYAHKRLFRIREETGRSTRPNLSAAGIVLAAAIIGWFAHPVWGWLGHVFEFLGDVIGSIPTIALQLGLAALSILVGYRWINGFLDERRTPAGLAKLTDDDWFRMISAGLVALIAALFFVLVSGVSSKALDVGDDFFNKWLAPKFDATTNVIDLPISEIEARLRSEVPGARRVGESLSQIGLAEGVPPKKLVDGLTAGVVVQLDNALVKGEISPAEIAERLETIKSRADNPLRWSRAEVVQSGQFLDLSPNYGINITRGFFALWVAVTLYTASFIAEVVRAGILAVSKGQSEAGSSLGLSRAQNLRHIVLPQAFRVIFPPLGNQYLNLFKNTSLGIAVAFPEIVAVGVTTINQTGQTVPVILVWMGFYLTGSLVISSIVNYYNRKLQLVER